VRVLGHELNNSLAPIRSIAGSLAKLVEREPIADAVLPLMFCEGNRLHGIVNTGKSPLLLYFYKWRK
jgi:hypothetical protein